MIPLTVYIFILIELVFVSWGDIRTKRIPNFWSLLNIIVFISLIFVFNDLYILSWKTFFYPVIWILSGFVFFLLKIMGGGDSKFLSTFFLLIPLNTQDDAFYYLILSTIFIGTSVFLLNIIRNWQNILDSLKTKNYALLKNSFGTKFSFAPVIFVSWIMLGWGLKIF